MGTNYGKAFYKDYEQLFQRNEKLAAELRSLQYNYNLISTKYSIAEQKKQELAEQNSAKDVLIIDLTKEVDRLKALLNIDGTNSGLPTSSTPINKKKVIPNSRQKTGKKIGGQHGHTKKKLERFADSEVDTYVEHVLDECSECQCTNLEDTGEVIEKDCLDYKVVVTKTRHGFRVQRCRQCGKAVHEKIPADLKEENQYGVQVQAMALTLMNQGNVSLNKVRVAQSLGYNLPSVTPDYGIHSPHLEFESTDIEINGDYAIGLHGTSRDSKLWPEMHWVSLADKFKAQKLKLLLPWASQAEYERALRIASSNDNVIVLPKLGIAQLASLISKARYAIGVDTGLSHLSAALGTPTVAIYTDTNPELTGVMAGAYAPAINLGNIHVIPSVDEVIAQLATM